MIGKLFRAILVLILATIVLALAIPFLLLALPVFIMAIPVLLVVLFIKWFDSGAREERIKNADESRVIQEIHANLTNMGDRIEALETIILERHSKRPL